MGKNDEDVKKEWGEKIFDANKTADDEKTLKSFVKMVSGEEAKSLEDKKNAVVEAFSTTRFDPHGAEETTGTPFERVNGDALLVGARKVLRLSRGEADEDNPDALNFKTIHTLEDLLAEKIQKGAGRKIRSIKNNLDTKTKVRDIVQTSLFSDLIGNFYRDSQLAVMPQQINPLEWVANQQKVTVLAEEGGISSPYRVGESTPMIDPSQLGYIDPIHTAECYSKDTEVFTLEGWKPWPEVTEETLFACRMKGRMEFHKAERLIAEHYKGTMYGLKELWEEYLVTPNHRVIYREYDGNRGKWQEMRADEIHGKDVWLLLKHKPYIGNGEVSREQLFPYLERFGWGDHFNRIARYKSDIPARVKNFDPAPAEFMPETLFHAPIEVREEFNIRLHQHVVCGSRRRFQTVNKRFADQFERLAIGMGYSVRHSTSFTGPYGKENRYKKEQAITMTSEPSCSTHVYDENEESPYYTCDYDDMIYCATVPGSMLYVRRNRGRGIWLGNSDRAGLTVHFALGATKKGNTLTQRLYNVKTGRMEDVTPSVFVKSVVAFPGEYEKKGRKFLPKKSRVEVQKNGEITYAAPSEVDYSMLSATAMFDATGALIPFLHNTQGNRGLMATKHLTQALSLKREKPR